MTWSETWRTLRYLFRPLATHVHILLVSCLLLALGLGTLQGSSPDQSQQQADQAPGVTRLSTSPITQQEEGDGNTNGSTPKSGSSSLYEAQGQPQQNAYVPITSASPLSAASEAPGAQSSAPSVACAENCPNTDISNCNSAACSSSSGTVTPSVAQPNSCTTCGSLTNHHLRRRCFMHCSPTALN